MKAKLAYITPPLPPPLYYGTDQTGFLFSSWGLAVAGNFLTLGGKTITPVSGSSHESRLPIQDNGNGTVIGYGATMATYQVSNGGPGFDANVQIPSGFTIPNFSYEINSCLGFPLEPQPGNTTAPPGGGMIVNTANGNNYRQWINGTAMTVNSAAYVMGLQNSTTPASPVVNAQNNPPFYSYFSYNDTNSVPYPTIWAPQTNSAGAVTSYNAIGLTMPQTGLSFQGNAGLFFNKNLQIAGGKIPTTPPYTGAPAYDAPFLWQNYQYHHLSDFYPGITNYSSFQVKALDDSGAITAIATPMWPFPPAPKVLGSGVAVVSFFDPMDWIKSGMDTSGRVKSPFGAMGYSMDPQYDAYTPDFAKIVGGNKQIWYSMCHGNTFDPTGATKGPYAPFTGLTFQDCYNPNPANPGKPYGPITAAHFPAGLNYRLVMLDGCSGAQTSLTSQTAAANADGVLPNCVDFANAFGANVAYVGWAWEVQPDCQKYTGKLIADLQGKGVTLQSAFLQFRKDNAGDAYAKLLKIAGKVNAIIDLNSNPNAASSGTGQ